MNETKVTFTVKDYEVIEGENKELIRKERSKDLEFIIDPSLNAQTRFESNFPIIAANEEDLPQYSKRMHDLFKNHIEKNGTLSLSEIGILLKIVYCWFDTDMAFKEFVKLFTFGDIEEQKKATDKLLKVMQMVFEGSAEKN